MRKYTYCRAPPLFCFVETQRMYTSISLQAYTSTILACWEEDRVFRNQLGLSDTFCSFIQKNTNDHQSLVAVHSTRFKGTWNRWVLSCIEPEFDALSYIYRDHGTTDFYHDLNCIYKKVDRLHIGLTSYSKVQVDTQ